MPDGRWQVKISLGTGPDGKRRRRSVYGATKREALEKAKAARREFEGTGTAVTNRRTTVRQWVGSYIAGPLESRVVAGSIERSTGEWYASMLNNHVVPALGAKRLASLAPSDIEAMLAGLAGVSQSTRRGAFTSLSRALDIAVRDGLIARNPASLVQRPAKDSTEAMFLDIEQLKALIAKAEGPMRVPVLILAVTGIRRGELLALRWSDVELEAGTLSVSAGMRRTKAEGLERAGAKTPSSRRTVPVPTAVIAELKSLKRDVLPGAPAFPTKSGGFQDPRNFNRKFALIAGKAGLDATPHALRHSAATAMIAAGVPLTTVADVLGHSDIRITASVYNHVVDAQRRAAVGVLGDALSG